jgi:hypothetical protein
LNSENDAVFTKKKSLQASAMIEELEDLTAQKDEAKKKDA